MFADTAQRHATFHDQWYLVEDLRPRLRPTVDIWRRMSWGRVWHLACDPDNNQHLRIEGGGYAFVSLLDGRRTVREAWERCQDGPDAQALTQEEVITLLGRLHETGFLSVQISADVETLLRRRQERRLRTLGSTLASFLFFRAPLFSPDAFFTRWAWWGGLAFRWCGFAAWLVLLAFAAEALLLNRDAFSAEARRTLDPANLGWVYAAIIVSKAVHECGHAFACKRFSAREGLHGDIHSLGVMFLFFTPLPFVDVSSVEALKSRWTRAAVGFGGIYAESFLAMAAVIAWSRADPGTALRLLARDCVVICSVRTLLFNANPLLKFDGYFVLCDLADFPNLYARAQAYIVYLFKRHVLGVARAMTVVERREERLIYPVYAIAAFGYRILLTTGIAIMLEGYFHMLGLAAAGALALFWFGWPLVKGAAYLVSGAELAGRRGRTIFRFLVFAGFWGFMLFAVPFEDAVLAEGVVESRSRREVYAEGEGLMASHADTDQTVVAGETELIRLDNPGLEAELRRTRLAWRVVRARMEEARDRGDADAENNYAVEAASLRQRAEGMAGEVARQRVAAPAAGVWVAPDLPRRRGKWIAKGDALGSVYDPADLRLRVMLDQFDAPRFFEGTMEYAELCVSGRMDVRASGNRLYRARPEGPPTPAGRREVFHAALASANGVAGPPTPGGGEKLANHVFELHLLPEPDALPRLRPGQKAQIRFVLGRQPLGRQWWRRLSQYFPGG